MTERKHTDYIGKATPKWCAFCGDYYILTAMHKVLATLGIEPHDAVIVSGIGCGSKTPHYINAYGFEGLHGRALPVATGIQLANIGLSIFVIGGDGDGYGIGANHFVQSCRRNLRMVYMVQNNAVYGLTKGQYSPSSQKGMVTPTSPYGAPEPAINPLTLALASGATFIARAYANDVKHLVNIIAEGARHKGFAFIDILQPCTTYNKINTPDWHKENNYDLNTDASYDKADVHQAFAKMLETDRVPIGIFYQVSAPTFDETFLPDSTPLIHQDITSRDLNPLLAKFR